MNKVYTPQEVADKLKIKKTTVYELIKRGELQSSKIGKQLRISEEQLDQYLNGPLTEDGARESGFNETHSPESSVLKRDYLLYSNGLILSGQNSPALDMLCSMLEAHPKGLPMLHSHMNSYNGLYSLYFEKIHIASSSLDKSYVSHLAPGAPFAMLSLYGYQEGFYVLKGNPKNITSVNDLKRNDIILANREKGSSSRILLDEMLKELSIDPDEVSGYRKELVSYMATAGAIVNHTADVALGDEYVAHQFSHLDFLPLKKCSMHLVFSRKALERPAFQALVEIVRSEEFRQSIRNLTGYDITETGRLEYL